MALASAIDTMSAKVGNRAPSTINGISMPISGVMLDRSARLAFPEGAFPIPFHSYLMLVRSL
jgi:hypothetical protein